MYAVIKTGGKQYRVSEGDEIFVEKLDAEDGKEVTFDEVLMIDGKIGTPYLDGASVTGTVLKHGKSKKIRIFKYKNRYARCYYSEEVRHQKSAAAIGRSNIRESPQVAEAYC